MKILVVVHDYLPAHLGGTELHAHQTARELARRGHEVTALFTERDLSAPPGTLRRGELEGVKTIELVHQREYEDVQETWRQELSGAVFRDVLAELGPDAIHFHHLALWGSGCLPAARASGARVVATLHDYFLLCECGTLLHDDGALCDDSAPGCGTCLAVHPLLAERHPGYDPDVAAAEQRERLLAEAATMRRERHAADLAAAETVICPSRFLADRFVAAGFLREAQVRVMKAGYPGPRRAPRRSDPARPLRVGYAGGIYPSKGVHVLVEAFQHLSGVPAELEVHGILDWFPDYVGELRAAGAGRPVSFPGRYEPDRVDDILARFDVLVVPSLWYENMPITIQEAFRNGLPVVASDLGGMREAVAHGVSGLTFPRGDAAALAGCLRRLAEDRDLLHRLASGRPEVPTLEAIVDGLEGLYAR